LKEWVRQANFKKKGGWRRIIFATISGEESRSALDESPIGH
jgi:hypothetical protein